MALLVRRAVTSDASGAVLTLRRSITELCVADHQGDPQELARWLANKTADAWANWVAREDALLLVAERDTKIVGVAMAGLGGEILLNYVHPEARFSRVSTGMLEALEAELRAHGVRHCRLESTATARRFYEGRGYLPEAAKSQVLSKSL